MDVIFCSRAISSASPEALTAQLDACGSRAIHALARDPPLREFPCGQLPAAEASASGFLQRLLVLPLGGRSGRRDRRHGRRACGCLTWWSGELDRMYAGEAQHPVFVALRGTVAEVRHPEAAFCRSDPRLHSGSDGHPLSRLGRRARLLRLFGESRWAGWCSICAAIPMPSGSGFPTPPAPACNWRTSGRT